jgi:hypothetical protein
LPIEPIRLAKEFNMKNTPVYNHQKLLALLLERALSHSRVSTHSLNDTEQLSMTAAMAFSAISKKEVSATAYVMAILARAKSFPRLSEIVLHIEPSVLDAAKRIDVALADETKPASIAPLSPVDALQDSGATTLSIWPNRAPTLRID